MGVLPQEFHFNNIFLPNLNELPCKTTLIEELTGIFIFIFFLFLQILLDLCIHSAYER